MLPLDRKELGNLTRNTADVPVSRFVGWKTWQCVQNSLGCHSVGSLTKHNGNQAASSIGQQQQQQQNNICPKLLKNV